MAAKRSGVGGRLTRKLGPAPVWAWALVLLAVAYLAYRLTAGRSSSVDVTAQPQPVTSAAAADQSAAQQPSGGAASVPGNLPPLLVSQPDTLQQQVQQTDTTSADSPQMLTAATPASAPAPSTGSYPLSLSVQPSWQWQSPLVNPANSPGGPSVPLSSAAPVSSPAPSLPIVSMGSGTGATGRKQAGF